MLLGQAVNVDGSEQKTQGWLFISFSLPEGQTRSLEPTLRVVCQVGNSPMIEVPRGEKRCINVGCALVSPVDRQ